MSTEIRTVECNNNKEVKKYINQAIEYYKKNKDEFVWMTERGNLYMTVWKCDDDRDYYVVVSNNYHSTYIPFENEDY